MEDPQLFSNCACRRIFNYFAMIKVKVKKSVVDYDDILWLIQQCTRYEQGLADGIVTSESGRRFMKCVVNKFKYYL